MKQHSRTIDQRNEAIEPQRFYSGFLSPLKRFRRDARGVTAIEFALIGAPFFALTIGVLELGLAFFVNRLVDNAALETARLIRTGQAHQTNLNAAAFKTEFCKRIPSFMCDQSRITIDITRYDQFSGLGNMPSLFNNSGELNDQPSYDIGGSSDIVVARFVYRWPMFTAITQMDAGDTGNMERLLFSTVVFRNEPFPW